MKIGIDARFLGTATGIGRYVEELIKGLEKESRNDFEFVIFLTREGYELYTPRALNFKKVLADVLWYSLAEQIIMPKIIAREKVDLMHYPHFNVPVMSRTPFVVTIHDLILLQYPVARATTLDPLKFRLKYAFYKFVIKYAVKKSQRIIVPSRYTKEQIIKCFDIKPEKIKVIYEGVSNIQHPIPNTQYLKQKGVVKSYLLYVGNAYPHKNLEGLIRVFEKLRQDPSFNYQLVLVGKNDYFYRRLKSQLAESLVGDVIFYNFAAEAELALLYKNASLYVFPSFCEGFGLPALEAQSFGAPVVAANSSCLPEIFGDAALYFNPFSDEDMAQKIKLALKDTALRDNLIQKGYERVKKYSWAKCASQTQALYLEL